MKDKGEFYILISSSGDGTEYEKHPVNVYLSEYDAAKGLNQAREQLEIFNIMREIVRSFGFQNTEIGWMQPSIFLEESLCLTIDRLGSYDSEYEIIMLPESHDKYLSSAVNNMITLISADSNMARGRVNKNGPRKHPILSRM